MSESNIFSRLSTATQKIQTVAKNLEVQQTKSSRYKAVSERDILDAVKPIEAECGIYSYPVLREIIDDEILKSTADYNGKTVEKTTFYTRIKTVYRFVNVDKPDEYIDTITFSEGIDSQDKGSGKAMTYADKYALMKAYKISTGDDPDKEASKEENFELPFKKVPQNIQKDFLCEICGNPFVEMKTPKGNYTAEYCYNLSKKKHGIAKCKDCIMKEEAEKKEENKLKSDLEQMKQEAREKLEAGK